MENKEYNPVHIDNMVKHIIKNHPKAHSIIFNPRVVPELIEFKNCDELSRYWDNRRLNR